MIIFAVVEIMGLIPQGPMDKAAQLAILVPAAIFVSMFAAGRIRQDLAEELKNRISSVPKGRFFPVLFLLLAVFGIWMVYGPFQGIPKGGDEAAYYFQSKIYASGHLSAPVPDVSDPSSQFPFRHFIFSGGKWFIVYTPFHSLVMAPFTAAGISPLLGPLEGLLSMLGIFLLIRIWSGETVARFSILLMLLSPFFLFMTTTFMAHNTNLLLITWSLYMFSRRVKEGGLAKSLAAGFLIGLAFTTKPYPVLAWMVFITVAVMVGCRKEWLRILLPAALAAAVPFALFLLSNWYYTGDPLHTGYDMVRGGKLIGFGPDKAWFPEYGDYAHTPLRGLINVARQIGVGSTIIFGWPFLSLIPMIMAFFGGLRDRRILWLYMPVGLIMILMWLHYCPAVDYGPRHYYTLMPVFMVLSVLGIREILRIARGKWGLKGSNFAACMVLGLFVIDLAVYMPQGVALRSGPWQTIDTMPRDVCQDSVDTPAIVFMQAGQYGYPNVCSGLNFDSPFLDGDIIYCAHQTTEEDMDFLNAYPGRNAYLYWYDGTDFHLERWGSALSDSVQPTRSMVYYTYLHMPDST